MCLMRALCSIYAGHCLLGYASNVKCIRFWLDLKTITNGCGRWKLSLYLWSYPRSALFGRQPCCTSHGCISSNPKTLLRHNIPIHLNDDISKALRWRLCLSVLKRRREWKLCRLNILSAFLVTDPWDALEGSVLNSASFCCARIINYNRRNEWRIHSPTNLSISMITANSM